MQRRSVTLRLRSTDYLRVQYKEGDVFVTVGTGQNSRYREIACLTVAEAERLQKALQDVISSAKGKQTT